MQHTEQAGYRNIAKEHATLTESANKGLAGTMLLCMTMIQFGFLCTQNPKYVSLLCKLP